MMFLFFASVLVSCATTGTRQSPSTSDNTARQKSLLEEINEKLLNENTRLKEEIGRLATEMKEQQMLTAQLQLSLLEKHAEVNKLLIKNDRLVNEFVRNKPQLRKRGNKVETARMMAEVAALIDTAKTDTSKGDITEIIQQAEEYLLDSQVELNNDNLDGAFYLATQALDLVKSTQVDNSSEAGKPSETEVVFLSHLPMRVLENSNVREKPAIQSKILFIEDAGSTVTAVGYSGLWVKVRLSEGEHGWIHYSLLSGAL